MGDPTSHLLHRLASTPRIPEPSRGGAWARRRRPTSCRRPSSGCCSIWTPGPSAIRGRFCSRPPDPGHAPDRRALRPGRNKAYPISWRIDAPRASISIAGVSCGSLSLRFILWPRSVRSGLSPLFRCSATSGTYWAIRRLPGGAKTWGTSVIDIRISLAGQVSGMPSVP